MCIRLCFACNILRRLFSYIPTPADNKHLSLFGSKCTYKDNF